MSVQNVHNVQLLDWFGSDEKEENNEENGENEDIPF